MSKISSITLDICTGVLDAHTAGNSLSSNELAVGLVAMELAAAGHKQLFKEFMAGFNDLPKPVVDNTVKHGPKGSFVLYGKKKLQVAAKQPTNNATDKFSKEATSVNSTITTQENFLANAIKPVASLEGTPDLPLGHPVSGSNAGAIYYVVAKTPGITVAMRWKGAQLSVRVAGISLDAISERLNATGIFANHADKGYYSAHLGQQGVIDDLAGSVSAQMLYASVLAAIAGDLSQYTERAPYSWRTWLSQAKQPAA